MWNVVKNQLQKNIHVDISIIHKDTGTVVNPPNTYFSMEIQNSEAVLLRRTRFSPLAPPWIKSFNDG